MKLAERWEDQLNNTLVVYLIPYADTPSKEIQGPFNDAQALKDAIADAFSHAQSDPRKSPSQARHVEDRDKVWCHARDS